eukprot:scaffold12970_cov113-Isochrysis_galbana.AAC.8
MEAAAAAGGWVGERGVDACGRRGGGPGGGCVSRDTGAPLWCAVPMLLHRLRKDRDGVARAAAMGPWGLAVRPRVIQGHWGSCTPYHPPKRKKLAPVSLKCGALTKAENRRKRRVTATISMGQAHPLSNKGKRKRAPTQAHLGAVHSRTCCRVTTSPVSSSARDRISASRDRISASLRRAAAAAALASSTWATAASVARSASAASSLAAATSRLSPAASRSPSSAAAARPTSSAATASSARRLSTMTRSLSALTTAANSSAARAACSSPRATARRSASAMPAAMPCATAASDSPSSCSAVSAAASRSRSISRS